MIFLKTKISNKKYHSKNTRQLVMWGYATLMISASGIGEAPPTMSKSP